MRQKAFHTFRQALLLWLCLSSQTQAESLLLTNATIYPDFRKPQQLPKAEQLLISEGRVLAVGREDVAKALSEMQKLKQDLTELDLKGRYVLPGFIESHTHPLAYAIFSKSGLFHQLSPDHLRSMEDVSLFLSGLRDQTKAGEWILISGWDPAAIPGLPKFDRPFLDRIFPEHPVFVLAQTMHSGFANSLAMKKADIDIRQKEQGLASGSSMDWDTASGELTGRLYEQDALRRVSRHIPLSFAIARNILKWLDLAYREYSREGYTTIAALGIIDMLGPWFSIPAVKISSQYRGRMADAFRCFGLSTVERPPVNIIAYYFHTDLSSWSSGPDTGEGYFRRIGIKFHGDGSPYAGSMAMSAPYQKSKLAEVLDIGSGQAPLLLDHSHFELMKERVRQGDQVAVHAHGDRTIEQILGWYSQLPRGGRHRLEHAGNISEEQLRDVARLGLSVSFYLDHIYYYAEALEELLGPERGRNFMPLGWALRHNVIFSLHSDSPASPPGAFRLIATAAGRRDINGRPGLAEHRIPVAEAIRAMTSNAAWQLHAENRIGTLAAGFDADFIVVSQDPLTHDPASIQVDETYKSGERVWSAPPSSHSMPPQLHKK